MKVGVPSLDKVGGVPTLDVGGGTYHGQVMMPWMARLLQLPAGGLFCFQ